MAPAMSMDLAKLEEAVDAQIASMVEQPPSRTEVEEARADEVDDVTESIETMLLPIVNVCNARQVLSGVSRRVARVSCKSCLSHLKPVRMIGEGADGQVWDLESGQAAKLGFLELLDETIPDERIESVLQEVAAARAAGRADISPTVHDAWFCTSATRIAYVIVMDRVAGGVSLRRWKAMAAPKNYRSLLERIEALTVRLNALGIFHNDLHESNIMVDNKDRPWIIDYSRCTFVDVSGQIKSKFGDVGMIRQHLADSYFPVDSKLLTRCIVRRLRASSVIEAKPSQGRAPPKDSSERSSTSRSRTKKVRAQAKASKPSSS